MCNTVAHTYSYWGENLKIGWSHPVSIRKARHIDQTLATCWLPWEPLKTPRSTSDKASAAICLTSKNDLMRKNDIVMRVNAKSCWTSYTIDNTDYLQASKQISYETYQSEERVQHAQHEGARQFFKGITNFLPTMKIIKDKGTCKDLKIRYVQPYIRPFTIHTTGVHTAGEVPYRSFWVSGKTLRFSQGNDNHTCMKASYGFIPRATLTTTYRPENRFSTKHQVSWTQLLSSRDHNHSKMESSFLPSTIIKVTHTQDLIVIHLVLQQPVLRCLSYCNVI